MGRGGTDDQGVQIGKAYRIAGRGSGWCGGSGHGIRIAGEGERCEGEVAGGVRQGRARGERTTVNFMAANPVKLEFPSWKRSVIVAT